MQFIFNLILNNKIKKKLKDKNKNKKTYMKSGKTCQTCKSSKLTWLRLIKYILRYLIL